MDLSNQIKIARGVFWGVSTSVNSLLLSCAGQPMNHFPHIFENGYF